MPTWLKFIVHGVIVVGGAALVQTGHPVLAVVASSLNAVIPTPIPSLPKKEDFDASKKR